MLDLLLGILWAGVADCRSPERLAGRVAYPPFLGALAVEGPAAAESPFVREGKMERGNGIDLLGALGSGVHPTRSFVVLAGEVEVPDPAEGVRAPAAGAHTPAEGEVAHPPEGDDHPEPAHLDQLEDSHEGPQGVDPPR